MAVSSFGGNAISSLQSILTGAVNRADAGTSAAQSGVNAILSGGSELRQTQGKISGQADKVNAQGAAINSTADDVKAKYVELSPIYKTLLGYGGDLWDEGASLSTEAKDLFGQGKALTTMDSSAGGLAGEFIKYWQSLSPDRYVSQATSDTQSSYGNALGQSTRELARRGVSATSGAYGALQKQFATSLATALAAAKTKARQTGLDQQAAQLDKMVSAANTLYNMGNSTEANALQAKGQAVAAQGKAGDIIVTQGQGYTAAGNLQATAGQMFSAAGNLYSAIGGLQTNYMSLLNSAYGNLANAHQAAAQTALGAANTEVRANTSGGGGGGGWSSSGSSSDSFWDKTGHSETWWHNNEPELWGDLVLKSVSA